MFRAAWDGDFEGTQRMVRRNRRKATWVILFFLYHCATQRFSRFHEPSCLPAGVLRYSSVCENSNSNDNNRYSCIYESITLKYYVPNPVRNALHKTTTLKDAIVIPFFKMTKIRRVFFKAYTWQQASELVLNSPTWQSLTCVPLVLSSLWVEWVPSN